MAAMNRIAPGLVATSLLLVAALALVACAAPAPGTSPTADPRAGVTPSPAAAAPTPPPLPTPASTPVHAPMPVTHAPRSKPAPPMSAPLPPERMPDPDAQTPPAAVNARCQVDADCAVMNVGSPQRPTCVNPDSPTVVQGAKANGVKPIDHCRCHQGQCRAEVMQVNSLPAQTR